jgi:hypothetical protein
MSNLEPNGAQFLQLLNAYQVEYLVIGGHAVALACRSLKPTSWPASGRKMPTTWLIYPPTDLSP